MPNQGLEMFFYSVRILAEKGHSFIQPDFSVSEQIDCFMRQVNLMKNSVSVLFIQYFSVLILRFISSAGHNNIT